MHKIFQILTATCVALPLLLSGGCASARSGPEIASVFDSGVAAYDAGRYEEAYKIWWSIRTEDLAAMRNVAMMLRKGQGVERDPRKAEQIYEVAAEAGLPTAQSDLAVMLLRGEAGKPDPQRALPLLHAAAAGGHPVAQFELGKLYESGELVAKDIEVARQLYAAAASRGSKEASERLAALPPPVPRAPAQTAATAAPAAASPAPVPPAQVTPAPVTPAAVPPAVAASP